jgi:phospholipid/cholesterol/gamma-HCH transport system substrate-binding protein
VNRSILVRMIALLIVTVAGVYYIAIDAAGVKVLNKPFTVHVIMPAAGGIYQDASVTYRGVDIGKVSSLHLYPDHVEVDLAIDKGAKIPANATASVRELTAAAEQYMDLVPASTDPPYLHAGSVIPEDRTSIPVSVGTALNSVNALVNSLHAQDLNTLSQALAQGLSGAGQDLRAIILDSNTIVAALQDAVPGTEEVINAGNNVLATFNNTSNEFSDFSANLNALTAQIDQSNATLENLLRDGSTASTKLEQFLSANQQDTITLIQNLSAVSNTTYARQAAFKAIFEVLPLFSTDVASVTTGGQIRFELNFNYQNTVCPYTSTMMEPTSLVALADLTGNCGTEAPDLLQRGADKAPPPQG